jgi:hypothetical protein
MVLSHSAALHDVVSRRVALRALTAPLGPNAEAAADPPVHAPWKHHSCPLPWRHVPRIHGPQCRRTRAAPPNQARVGVHAARRHRPFAPYFGHATAHALTWFPWCARKPPPTALRTAIKQTGPSSREHRAAVVRHGCLTVSSTPACFSSPTRAAPHSFRTPCSSCACLLVCSSCQLAGVISPAAAARQPLTGSASRSSPEPTNHLSTFPRPQ